QTPLSQYSLAPHAVPQAPQFLGCVSVETQTPPQSTAPPVHSIPSWLRPDPPSAPKTALHAPRQNVSAMSSKVHNHISLALACFSASALSSSAARGTIRFIKKGLLIANWVRTDASVPSWQTTNSHQAGEYTRCLFPQPRPTERLRQS